MCHREGFFQSFASMQKVRLEDLVYYKLVHYDLVYCKLVHYDLVYCKLVHYDICSVSITSSSLLLYSPSIADDYDFLFNVENGFCCG